MYQTVELAQKFWIKGDEFSLHSLLHVAPDSAKAKQFEGASLAICRLAPADYHRFHSPIDGEIGEVTHIPGQYYTGEHLISVYPVVYRHSRGYGSEPTGSEREGL